MKKIIFLLLTILFTGHLISQEIKYQKSILSDIISEVEKRSSDNFSFKPDLESVNQFDKYSDNSAMLDSIVSYRFESKADSIFSSKTLYNLNENGDVILILKYKWSIETSSWFYNIKNEKLYDDNGNEIQNTSFKWDTLIDQWLGTYKREYCFDNLGNRLMVAYYNWDLGLNQWVGSTKYEYAYYSSGKLQMSAVYTWSTDINNWVGMFMDEFIYDVNDFLTTVIEYMYSGEWIAQYKSEYINDDNGNTVLRMRDIWSGIDWEKYQKYEFTYITDTLLVLTMISDWVYDDWEEIGKRTYEYDENGNETLYATYSKYYQQWHGLYKRTAVYDESRNRIQRIIYDWNDELVDWVYRNQYDVSYDENGNMLSFFYYYNWDVNLKVWKNKFKEEYTYNGNNQIMEFEYYEWDVDASKWSGIIKEMNSYDSNNNLLLKTSFDWIAITNDWVLSEKAYYYYIEDNSSINNQLSLDLIIYPNPSNDIFHLKTNTIYKDDHEVRIVNIAGQVIYKQKLVPGEVTTIDLTHQPKGIYFYHIQSSTETISGKLIKID